MADVEAIEANLEAALTKIAASGIRSYQINGRTVTFNTPEELIRALQTIQASKIPTGSASPTTYAEVVD